MKKFFSLYAILLLIFFAGNLPEAGAVIHTVSVGNFFFNPSSISGVNPGDTIRWVWAAGTHTTTSTTIPAGAATWDEPITSSNTTYDYVPTVPGTYNYKCTPHAAMGMVGSFTVVNLAPLTVTASATPSSLCQGNPSQLLALPSGGTGTYSYSWTSVPPGFTSNQQSPVVNPLLTTLYNVTVISGSESASASVTVNVTPNPVCYAGKDTSYCNNVGVIPLSGTASGYSSVSWSTPGDGTFANGNTLSATYIPGPTDITGGVIEFILTANPLAPCVDPATDNLSIILDPCTGIQRLPSAGTIRVAPNPTYGQVVITASGLIPGQYELSVLNLQGIAVSSEKINVDGTSVHLDYDLGRFPSGIYYLRLTDGKTMVGEKILVQ